MLFAIAGSQGTGKSTLLKALADAGHNVIDRKVSRSILVDWGKTLDEVYKDLPLCQQFHKEIASRKWKDEVHAMDSKEIWFTERTYADSYTYALFSLGRYNEYSNWLNDYWTLSLANNQLAYAHIFFLPAGKFEIEKDGVRAHNTRYGHIVDQVMTDITVEMANIYTDNLNNHAITFVNAVEMQTRVGLVNLVVDMYKKHGKYKAQ
jgi:predicted ATPase